MKLLVLLSMFGLALCQDSGGGGSGGGDNSGGGEGGSDGGEGGSGGGGNNGGGGQTDRCEEMSGFDECVADGYNGTCIWAVSNGSATDFVYEEDCGYCVSVQGSCIQTMLSASGGNRVSLHCDDDGSDFAKTLCQDNTNTETKTTITTGTETETSTNYDCTDDWEDQDCDEYANWNGTIVATTSSYNFRWLCFGCEWERGFVALLPEATLFITLEADCYSIDDEVTSTDANTEDRRRMQNGGGGTGGGESDSGGENSGGDGGSDGENGGNNGGGDGGGNTGGGGDGGGSNGDYTNTDATEYTITIEVEAYFGSCRALAGVTDVFSDLKDRIEGEDEFSDISVYIQCSEMDCCEDDDICSTFTVCDTDGDGNTDVNTIDGVDNSGGNNSSDGNGLKISMTLVAFVASVVSMIL